MIIFHSPFSVKEKYDIFCVLSYTIKNDYTKEKEQET